MTSWFWKCTNGCQWLESEQFDKDVRRYGEKGQVRNFDELQQRHILRPNDAFCAVGLGKAELAMDLASPLLTFVPESGSIYVWGHRSGINDLVYVVVVTDLSALHLNPRARPQSWSQRLGPVKRLSSTELGNAIL